MGRRAVIVAAEDRNPQRQPLYRRHANAHLAAAHRRFEWPEHLERRDCAYRRILFHCSPNPDAAVIVQPDGRSASAMLILVDVVAPLELASFQLDASKGVAAFEYDFVPYASKVECITSNTCRVRTRLPG